MCKLPFDLGPLSRIAEKVPIKVAWSRASIVAQTARYLDHHQVIRLAK